MADKTLSMWITMTLVLTVVLAIASATSPVTNEMLDMLLGFAALAWMIFSIMGAHRLNNSGR